MFDEKKLLLSSNNELIFRRDCDGTVASVGVGDILSLSADIGGDGDGFLHSFTENIDTEISI